MLSANNHGQHIKNNGSTKPISFIYQVFCVRFEKGKDLPLGAIPTPPPKQTNQSAPKVVILSPHPDDECVMGANT